MKRILFLLTAILSPWLFTTAQASSITVPFTGSYYVSSAQYQGQTFTALPGFAKDLTVYVQQASGIVPFDFRLLIIGISADPAGAALIHPKDVLFESNTFSLHSTPGFVPTTVDLGQLALVAGTQYAWIIDSFVTGTKGFAWVGVTSVIVGSNIVGPYSEGDPFSASFGPLDFQTRSEQFEKGFWNLGGQYDYAFSLNFDQTPAVPEPSSFLLFITGIFAFPVWKSIRERSEQVFGR